MKKTTRLLWGAIALFSLGALFGCGSLGAGGGQPVTQPIATHPPVKKNTTSHEKSKTGETKTGSPSPSSTGGSTQKEKSQGSGSGNSPGNGSAPPVQKPKTVTVHVNGSLLAATPVSITGTGGTFVPVSSTVTKVLLPTGWTQQTSSMGSGGTIIKLINPNNSSEMISEVIQTSARDLQAFYAGQSSDRVTWIVPKQIVGFTLQNPNNPYTDRGIEANISTGGSIRLDIYLPDKEAATAQQIMNSFIGAAN